MTKLRYHQQAFDKLGMMPEVDPDAVKLLDQREDTLEVRFPESFREFYSLLGAKRILSGAADIVTALAELGNDYTPDFPLILIFHDWYGPPTLYLHLTEKSDPDVRIAIHGNENDLDDNGFPIEIAGSFSQVVLEQVNYLLEYERQQQTRIEDRSLTKWIRNLF